MNSQRATGADEVAVIGAGVAGIQAALDLAQHNVRVHLIEREPYIGGHMAQLDKTFPTNDCSMCILSPKMAEVARHPNIILHTLTEVVQLEGKPGNFILTLKRNPRYVDESLCNGCGDCIQICPVEVYNRFDAGIGVRKAIYKPHSQAIPDLVVKDSQHCIDCGLCYDVCGVDAIRREEKERTEEIHVASIILAVGYTLFDACRKAQYRYLMLPDVITSLELERMMNASGPTGGEIKRLSNGKRPSQVAFIQCVGSRDSTVGRPYCSCVCCMFSIKNAILLKEKYPDMDVCICYIDVRAYGKGYEEYYERAKGLGIRFIRGIPGSIEADDGGMTMQLENTETGEVLTLHPELVVLAVGMDPSPDLKGIADRTGISLGESGFANTRDETLSAVETVVPGIYVAGTVTAPRDIPDSVAMGSAAAMHAFMDVLRARAGNNGTG